ncbi:MAG: hypothetical protein Kow0013_04600 [Pararhodobacter sp.]
MFTLTRPVSALLIGGFAFLVAPHYELLYGPDFELGHFEPWVGYVGLAVGWVFVGGLIGRRALWFSIYAAAQGIVLTAVVSAGMFAVRQVFILGYRQRIREPFEAVLAIPQIAWDYLRIALQKDFLLLLGGGALILGLMLHLIHAWMERRRNAR